MTDSTIPDVARAYLDRFASTWTDESPAAEVRFVVLDTETTGFDPRRDRIITIGAVGVRAGEIRLDDAFEVMMKVAYNTSAVTVHGITHEEAREGFDEAEALAAFLEYLGDGVIVGHHIGHDVSALDAACERHFGIALRNSSLDTMDLTLHLQRDGAFAGRPAFESFSLDALCDFFDITPHDRHTAGGDAFMTALIFLRLLHVARVHGRGALGALAEPFEVDHG